jgi:hypothetical protein
MLTKGGVFKGGKDQIFCSATESDHPRRRPKMEKAKQIELSPGGEGGYLDGVDDEAGEEEEQAEGEHY